MDKIKNIIIVLLLCVAHQAVAQKMVTGTVTEIFAGSEEP